MAIEHLEETVKGDFNWEPYGLEGLPSWAIQMAWGLSGQEHNEWLLSGDLKRREVVGAIMRKTAEVAKRNALEG